MSLLWPKGRSNTRTTSVSDQTVADLRLEPIVEAVAADASTVRLQSRQHFVHQVFTQLLRDPEDIAYRQAVLTDLLAHPSLRESLQQTVPKLEALADVHSGERYRPTVEVGLERVARRLADLELLVEAVVELTDALRRESKTMHSDGLCELKTSLEQLRATAEFSALERELPGLRERLSSVRSVTLGVNLGADLTPESATILNLRDTPVDGRRSLLFRLLGSTSEALTPLQRGEGGSLRRPNELVRDLRHLLSEVVAPIDAALQRFSRLSTDSLRRLGPELALLLGEAALIERLRSRGLPMSCPEVLDANDRRVQIEELYDVGLALNLASDELVTNAARFDSDAGRVWVLTGPNRGGKTTFTRAVGLAQIFLQVGMYVPARVARMSPADGIYTHFPAEEEAAPGRGRLDVEAERLAGIFHHATPHSLILLNEALSGTSALEALDLARGLVRALRLLGARAIYVTHLHELALHVEEINATTPGDGPVASLLADASDPTHRSYRIVPGPPTGKSFAAEIAEQHGISFEQLARLLQERDIGS